jgi:hypothetical protein
MLQYEAKIKEMKIKTAYEYRIKSPMAYKMFHVKCSKFMCALTSKHGNRTTLTDNESLLNENNM